MVREMRYVGVAAVIGAEKLLRNQPPAATAATAMTRAPKVEGGELELEVVVVVVVAVAVA